MVGFILSRLLQLVLVVVGIATLLFVLLRLSGDPALVVAGGEYASPQVIASVKQELGLDKPLVEQYAIFMGKLAQLDFGKSYFLHEPALDAIFRRLPATLILSVCALVVSLLIAFPIGIIAGINRNSMLGRALMVFAFLGQSIPSFWLALLLILLFSVQLRWLPSFGYGDIKNLILPTIAVAGFSMARTARLVRSGMIEAMSQDYIRTARAKGVREQSIVVRHAIKNMMIPVVTTVGIQVGSLIGGAVLVETVFAYPGIGSLLVQAVGNRDYPVAQGVVFLIAVAVVLANTLVDLSYSYLDPRIQHRR